MWPHQAHKAAQLSLPLFIHSVSGLQPLPTTPAVTDGPRSAEFTHPEHADDGMLHRVRDLSKTSTEGDTTHHVW